MNKRYADIINEIGKSSFDKNEFIKWLFNDSNDNPQSFNSELFENYKKIIVANMKTMKCARLKKSPQCNYGYIYDNFVEVKIDYKIGGDDLSYYEKDFILMTIILVVNNILVIGVNKDTRKYFQHMDSPYIGLYYTLYISNQNIEEIQNKLTKTTSWETGQSYTLYDRQHVKDLKDEKLNKKCVKVMSA